jgi:hypothetical protein
MATSAFGKHPLLVLSLLVGHGALLGATAPSASAKEREIAAMDNGVGRVVLETHSVRDLGHGYAIARAFVYGPQGVKGAMTMAVDGCGDDHGHIVMSSHPADIDLYEWRTGGPHFYDRLAMTACKNR